MHRLSAWRQQNDNDGGCGHRGNTVFSRSEVIEGGWAFSCGYWGSSENLYATSSTQRRSAVSEGIIAEVPAM
jgi:hypothetical protein